LINEEGGEKGGGCTKFMGGEFRMILKEVTGGKRSKVFKRGHEYWGAKI